MAEQLTLEIIQNSPRLRQLAALPGDEIKDGKLIRKFSEEGDRMDLGEEITQEKIDLSPKLKMLEAKPGDRIVNKKLVRTGKDSAYEQFVYRYDKAQGAVALGTDILEAKIPLGRFSIDFENGFQYFSPETLYGKGFMEANIDQRREMIERARERGLIEEYGEYFEPNPESIAGTAGEVVGIIADPTTAIAPGATLPRVMGVSAGLGSGYSVLEDLATTGEIDGQKALEYGAFGAGGGAVGYAIGKGVGVGVKKIQNKSDLKTIEEAEQIIAQDIKNGFSPNEAMNNLVQKIDNEKLTKSIQRTGKQLKIPPTQSQAAKIANDSVVNDSATSRVKSGALDNFLGTLSTRIRNISETVGGKLRHFEYKLHTNTANTLKKVQPFIDDLRNMNPVDKTKLTRSLYNGNFDEATSYMNEPMKENFNIVKNTLEEIYGDTQKAGIFFQKLDDYFPRQVKDIDKFRESLGIKNLTRLTELENEYAKRLGLDSAKDLSLAERSLVANQYVRGFGLTTDRLPRFVKKRKIKDLTEKQISEFYEDPADALSLYIRGAIDKIEKYKFFGRNALKTKDGVFNINKSIGAIIESEKAAGRLNPLNEDQLVDLLQSRFISGDKQMRKGFGTLRDLGYMGTIANPYSAITQFGDLGNSGALHGFRNTFASLFGTKDIKLIDVGIENMSKEFAEGNVRGTVKALNFLFDITGFRTVDRLGKETLMNASFKKAINQVKTPKGEAAFRKQHKELYGFQPKLLDDIVADLKAGKVTDNTKFHAFNELSDVQPITLSEMPQGYLDNPNGRLFYMLKSFTLKQIDVARRKVVQEWKKGNKLQATKNATALAAYLTTFNLGTKLVKDMITGRDIRPEMLPKQAVYSLLGVYGINEYNTSKYIEQGKLTEFFMQTIAPAMPVLDAAATGVIEGLGPIFQRGGYRKTSPEDFASILRVVPGAGPIIYNWFGGGAEKYNRRLRKEARNPGLL